MARFLILFFVLQCIHAFDMSLPESLAALEIREWGVATAAYQVEGAANEGGRGPSIWDVFSHIPGKTYNGETGDVADDMYHLYKSDIALMTSLGIESYRFSISWTRILPTGKLADGINQEGIEFYHALLDALDEAGIEPLVTIYHWDLPQHLEEEYGGWLGAQVVDDFADYAQVLYDNYGDRISKWITFNEAYTFIGQGYVSGVHAPGRCDNRERCAEGDSLKEPLLAAHHVFLAHGKAVAKFREMYGRGKGMEIGMTNCGWKIYPLRPGYEPDIIASQEFMEATWGWFFDPVIFGDYPESLKERAGDDIPKFTAEETEMLRSGGIDFLGVNYYTSQFVGRSDAAHKPSGTDTGIPALRGKFTMTPVTDSGELIGPPAGTGWLFVVPQGLRDLLVWLDHRYHHLPIRITENGCAQPSWINPINDTFRVDYYRSHIEAVAQAVEHDNIKLLGYYAWSLFDNYEWADGYRTRFGIVYVDYETQVRTPKLSALYYADVISAQKKMLLDRTYPKDEASEDSEQDTMLSHISEVFSSFTSGILITITASILILGIAFRRRAASSSTTQTDQQSASNLRVELPKMLTHPRVVGPRHQYERIE